MNKLFAALLLLFVTSFSVAQDLAVTVELSNANAAINNGKAFAKVTGGAAPYSYKWSKQDVPLTSDSATGLAEGIGYGLTVTDARGKTVELKKTVPAESVEEHMNAFFKPVVNAIGSVLFWDPFAAVGLWDPGLYDDNGVKITHPNGDHRTQGIPFIVVWLVIGAIIFTFRMRFVNVWGVRHAFDLVRGKYDAPGQQGEVSHFQALTAALSATVGLGNIAGVAVAITVGGPGATLWMIVAGLLGMTSKFVECTLGVKYRKIDENGRVSGGPMYYLTEGLKKRNMGTIGKVLAGIFAVLCVGGSFGGGNMFQANQAFDLLQGDIPFLQGNGFWFGVVMAALVAVVIIGGIKSIAKVTDKIVPVMCGMYVLVALIIIGLNITNVGEAVSTIFAGAFSAPALKGGIIGVLIVGFQRAAFSNEAGVGSASIAHSASKTDEPVSEGVVALLEPFIDTVVVCTMTALVLIFTGFADGIGPNGQAFTGAELTSQAFSSVFPWFKYLLMLAIVLFAFSTMISWSYYGLKAWTYLFGDTKAADISYKVLFLVFIVVGASIGLGAVLDFSDLMILGMAFPNILGLYFMAGEVKQDLKSYFARIKSGEIQRYDN